MSYGVQYMYTSTCTVYCVFNHACLSLLQYMYLGGMYSISTCTVCCVFIHVHVYDKIIDFILILHGSPLAIDMTVVAYSKGESKACLECSGVVNERNIFGECHRPNHPILYTIIPILSTTLLQCYLPPMLLHLR